MHSAACLDPEHKPSDGFTCYSECRCSTWASGNETLVHRLLRPSLPVRTLAHFCSSTWNRPLFFSFFKQIRLLESCKCAANIFKHCTCEGLSEAASICMASCLHNVDGWVHCPAVRPSPPSSIQIVGNWVLIECNGEGKKQQKQIKIQGRHLLTFTRVNTTTVGVLDDFGTNVNVFPFSLFSFPLWF